MAVMLCMLWYVMSCHVMSCYVCMLCAGDGRMMAEGVRVRAPGVGERRSNPQLQPQPQRTLSLTLPCPSVHHWYTRQVTHLLTHLLTYLLTYLLTLPERTPLVYKAGYSLTYSLTYLLTYLLTYPDRAYTTGIQGRLLTYLLTYLLTLTERTPLVYKAGPLRCGSIQGSHRCTCTCIYSTCTYTCTGEVR